MALKTVHTLAAIKLRLQRADTAQGLPLPHFNSCPEQSVFLDLETGFRYSRDTWRRTLARASSFQREPPGLESSPGRSHARARDRSRERHRARLAPAWQCI